MRSKRRGSIKQTTLGTAVLGISVLLCFIIRAAFAGDYGYETVYAGLLDSPPPIKSTLIRSKAELVKAEAALGMTDALPAIDFGKEVLILVTAERGEGGVIDIKSADIAAGGGMEIRYSEELTGPVPREERKPAYTYLIARLSPAPGKDTAVRFINDSYTEGLASDTGVGQFREYTNVLSGGEGLTFTEFLPLEKGNTWTYRVENDKGVSEVTNSVVSESDGWSVFDKFFGISGVGMKIAPGGRIYVASKDGIKTFYNSDVVAVFPKSGIKTPAGDFEDVMVVSIPEGRDFWFRDVYAKGVGLVYHEQKSMKGRASYSLVSARVGGTEYPKKNTPDRRRNRNP